MTGNAAAGPMSPSPNTAVPSLTTATNRERQVYFAARDSSAAIAADTSATPGVYAMDNASLSVSGRVLRTVNLPPS